MNPEYRVHAFNTASASENKIHDDTVAKQFGFRGGLVPGVDVYAYLTHPIVNRWGRPWLEHGTVSVRFLNPVYDGEEVVVTTTTADDGDLDLEARNPNGELCATARAAWPRPAPRPPDLTTYPTAPVPDAPPPPSPQTLLPGAALGSFEMRFDADCAVQYLADVRETLPIYHIQRLAHPGLLLRTANYILAINVRLGPWIHAASTVQNFAAGTDGAHLCTRGRVHAVYEKRGHRFVDLDLLIVADGTRPIAHIRHTAIYEPRQSAAT